MKLTLEHIYIMTGMLLLIFTFFTILDKRHPHRIGSALFWFIYGLTFLIGSYLPYYITGILVVIMALLAGAKQVGMGDYKSVSVKFRFAAAKKLGNKLFIPTLIVPVITFFIAAYTSWGALVGFGIGAIIAYIYTLFMTKINIGQSFNEGRRLMDAISWAAILSQLLAALGFLFDKAGVGKIISQLFSSIVPPENLIFTIIAYCLGMAIFTMIMGNAFAAFAVMTTGLALPLLVGLHSGNAAAIGVLGMLAGYSGTLLTPMAANFNIVPAALLEMQDKNSVIKAQMLIALIMLFANICLMYCLAF